MPCVGSWSRGSGALLKTMRVGKQTHPCAVVSDAPAWLIQSDSRVTCSHRADSGCASALDFWSYSCWAGLTVQLIYLDCEAKLSVSPFQMWHQEWVEMNVLIIVELKLHLEMQSHVFERQVLIFCWLRSCDPSFHMFCCLLLSYISMNCNFQWCFFFFCFFND